MKNERKKNAILGQRTGFARTEKSFEITNLDNIVTELNRLHQSILTAGKNMVRFAVEAGEILTKKRMSLNMENLFHGSKIISILKFAPHSVI